MWVNGYSLRTEHPLRVRRLRAEEAESGTHLNVREFQVDERDAKKVTLSFWPPGLTTVSFSTVDFTDVVLRDAA